MTHATTRTNLAHKVYLHSPMSRNDDHHIISYHRYNYPTSTADLTPIASFPT
jgi:hypothetical protein